MGDASVLSFQYTYVYAAVNLFCVFIAVLILSKFSSHVGNNREIQLFRAMTVAYLTYLVLEIVWVLALAGIIPLSPLATGLVKMVDTMFIPLMVFFWFWFAEERFHSGAAGRPLVRFLFSIPIVLMWVLYFTSFYTGIVFHISPQRTVEPGPLIALTGIVDNFYGIAIILHAASLFLKEKDRFRRKDYWIQMSFIIMCTIGGILDTIVTMTPVMTLTIAFSFAYLFVNLLEPQIYNDALTGLNNRRRADRYLSEKIEETSPENPFYLFMADVDRFKQINDSMGHLEGDQALKTVADAVAATTDEFHGFAARWGGDEFLVMIRHAKDEDFPLRFAALLGEKIKHYADHYGITYPLAMSMGHALCESPEDGIESVIETADKMLYQNKRERLPDYKR